MACRQVEARPTSRAVRRFGGVGVCDPPPRPGAPLWSIAAGPDDERDANSGPVFIGHSCVGLGGKKQRTMSTCC